MTFLIRPQQGRLAGGVARAIAEQYQIHPGIVRAVFVTAILSAPLTLLLYLLLWSSIPSEDAVLEDLQLSQADPTIDRKERFDRLSSTLLARLGVTTRRRGSSSQLIAFTMLVIAFVLELPRLEGSDFYYAHPYVSGAYAIATRHASALFYLALAFAFFAMDRVARETVELRVRQRTELAIDRGRTRIIGGVASGIGYVLGVDPAYIRVVLVLMNVFTFGGVGILYLVTFWLLRAKGETFEEVWRERPQAERTVPLSQSIRIFLGFLFMVLAIIRITTEYRAFFFNEPFFRGAVLLIVGSVLGIRAVKFGAATMIERLWLIAGVIVLLFGIFDLSTAIFQVQLTLSERFEIAFFAGALAFLYYTLVVLAGKSQRVGYGLAALFLFFGLMLQFNMEPSRYLLAIVQFYDFFFPVMFAGFGLWLVMER